MNYQPAEASGTGYRRYAFLLAGPLLALALILFCDLSPGRPAVTRTAGVALWMAVWWITEAVPLAATALLPVVLYPLLGIMSGKQVAPVYFNHIIFLFIGGFVVALAMQEWKLHRRIALRILNFIGVNPRRILLGCMLSTAFLSMWISNTAATMMMVPIVLAVVLNLEENLGEPALGKYPVGLFLGVAYGATLGGIATLVGTPPNLSFARILAISFPEAPDIGFAAWFIFAFPISVVFLALVWLLLGRLFPPAAGSLNPDPDLFRDQLRALGPIRFEEKVVLADFTLLALLWLFRADIELGVLRIPGWSRLFPDPALIDDGTVAILMAVILFVIPSRQPGRRRIMTWEIMGRLPWNIVVLFGGGFALAQGFRDSGLSEWLGQQLSGLGAFHPVLLVMAVSLLITFLTELTSNTATAEMLLPILAALGAAIGVNPLLLMIPGTLSCSLAFMLPVATPPNAIIFGTGKPAIRDMVRAGIYLNFTGVALITLAIFLWGRVAFGLDLTALPDWVP